MTTNILKTKITYKVDTEKEALDIQNELKQKYNIVNFNYKFHSKKTKEDIIEYYIVEAELEFNTKNEQNYDVIINIEVKN